MISARDLTKRYGKVLAVDGVTFDVQPGRVTGFLGPNGAGKSTTMRMILGLDTPTAGRVTIGGTPYRDLAQPLRTVGALLDAKAVDGARTAANHLRWLADSNGLGRHRVGAVLDGVGLTDVADVRVRNFSLGMNQRLGIAAALLGDPPVVMFDEPINGLDPDGIIWLRGFLKNLAAEGRTVFLSSHLMSEMSQVADHLIVIGAGRIIADASLTDIVSTQASSVFVRAERQVELARQLAGRGAIVDGTSDGALNVRGVDSAAIGAVAASFGIPLVELTPHNASLEDAFLELTHHSTQYRAGELAHATTGA
jgi:ABC-2 type transport system ATP-binding protein